MAMASIGNSRKRCASSFAIIPTSSSAMLARIGRVDGTEEVGEGYALIQVLEGKLAPWGTASSFPEAVEITLKEWATRQV